MPTLRLQRLPKGAKIINPDGTPTQAFSLYWQRHCEEIETAVNAIAGTVAAIAAALAAASAANAAAVVAQTAANDITAANSLASSYVTNFTPPMVSSDNAGLVTIAAHDRVYGNGTTVAVNGGTVATGQVNPAIVYIYYDQASRAGGAVTYAYSLVEGDAAQIGDRHSVGAVAVPAAGTASGGYARPPGYGGIEP